MNINQSIALSLAHSWNRIRAIMLLGVRQMHNDPIYLVQTFFYAAFNFTLWGIAGRWLHTTYTDNALLQLAMMTTLFASESMVRASLDVMGTLLIDISDRNIANLFASPLAAAEYVLGTFLVALMNQPMVFLLAVLIGNWFCQINILHAPLAVVPFWLTIFISGLGVGLCGASLLISTGRRFFNVIFMLARTAVLIGGTLYPVEGLPLLLRGVARLFPVSYATDAIRLLMMHQIFSWQLLAISVLMSLLYLGGGFYLFLRMFARSKQHGLMRLND